MATLEDCYSADEDCYVDDELDMSEELDWQYMPAAQLPSFYFSDRPVDGELLVSAVDEIKKVCANAKRIISSQSAGSITLSDCVNYFLGSICPLVFEACEEGSDADDPVLGCDLVVFIRTLAALSVHKCTPASLFEPKWIKYFPMASQLDYGVFKKVLKSLKRKRNDVPESLFWDAQFNADELVRRAERAFTQASSRIAYVPRQTIISLDDDQYRLRSAASERMGFVRINNPKKAFGIVSTNAVSLVSSMVIGMRLIGKGENFDSVVRIILMWMQGVDLPDHVRASDDLICLDRGYLGPSLIEFLMKSGFSLIGTHKRVNSYPFTFGDARNRASRRLVEEVGCKSIYVAKKKFHDRHLFAIAYRSGKGRVATLICSNPRLGLKSLLLNAKC